MTKLLTLTIDLESMPPLSVVSLDGTHGTPMKKLKLFCALVGRSQSEIDYIRILNIGLELACNGG